MTRGKKAAERETAGAMLSPIITRWTVTSHALIPIVLLAIGLVVAGDGYLVHLGTLAMISYVLTASYNLILGYAGIFSLAHVAIYGIGAYLGVYAQLNWGFSFWAAIPLTLIAGGVVGLLLAWPTAHLKGIFIAVATLGFAVAVTEILNAWKSVTGGAGGLLGIPIPEFFGNRLVGGSIGYFWVCAAVVWLMFEISMRVDRSGLSRRFIALRENPRSLSAVGVKPARVRMVAFVVGSSFAAVAGLLFAHFQLALSPESFDLGRLVALLLATLIGGAGKLYGPIVGVVALVIIDEIGFGLGDFQLILYGIAILVLLSLNSTGVVGLLEAVLRRFRKKPPTPIQRVIANGAVPAEHHPEISAPGPAALSVVDMEVRFGGVAAVNKSSFEVRAGETVGLIGPNGAGKTTLFNAITGDVKSSSGTVKVGDADITGRGPDLVVLAGVARTFQSPSLVKNLTVIQNVMLGGESQIRASVIGQLFHSPVSCRDDKEQYANALECLQRLGIAEYAHEIVANLSYGIMRLTEIARNLMLNPTVLLLDEPGAGLTEEERLQLAAVLRGISSTGSSVVLVDHNMSLISAASERLIVIDHGVVLTEGPTEEVLRHPEVITAYLGGEVKS